ncbi:uncharacterized protein LOC127254799 isoform X2 [Andrographis paniculata]|uniref:uncharacterized protein LOC127254799 isoform X2 n=1 Tax=Andrographis paniculata TaxID=175694 RepID=UPI0021E78992|nr:uncharacterized protein LOC127254799 isoform X2 [Andrographis paniculata]
MAISEVFGEDDMAIDEGLGYPKAYAKLCRDKGFGPYSHGPPFAFMPYALAQEEDSRANELDALFPIIDPKAKPTTKPKIFLNLLWKQLSHLGNAGFDPEIIRVDPFGNVLYYHADAASPLAWDIDHWFPCSRGGLTVLSNLRILQWQVCRRKHDKLEFLIPWWDFQLGVSINQFLSIFASSNSDFRHRAFSWLFSEGEYEELNASQTVDSHSFPQHFLDSTGKVGLAPAAVVRSRRESFDAPLKVLDFNRRPRPSTPIVATKKIKQFPKENQDPMMSSNPYQAIVLARDSLKQREETAKMQAEIHKLDNEVGELQQKTEEQKLSIQELEMVLMKKRRRAEKCRRLADSQSSYRAMLEKMIRDAMHQSVIYKEQVRLNQAAASALMARLEAQKAICDSAERDLHMKHRQRDELEKQMSQDWDDQERKRSRTTDDSLNEKDDNTPLYLPEPEQETDQTPHPSIADNGKKKAVLWLPEIKSTSPSHKELRRFLEEEQRASATSFPQIDEEQHEEEGEEEGEIVQQIQDGDKIYNLQFPVHHEPEEEEDEEIRRQRGKGNIEKWLQFLLEDTIEDADFNPQQCSNENETNRADDDFVKKLNLIYPHAKIKVSAAQGLQQTENATVIRKTVEQQKVSEDNNDEKTESSIEVETTICKTPYKNPPYKIAPEKTGAKESASMAKETRRMSSPAGKASKEKELLRSESARGFRRIPSSPSLLLGGMKKRVDCIGKKPSVLGDNDNEDYSGRNSFLKSSIKTIKRAVRI